jgi:Tfp pilus assembly PilM family ATPase
MNWGLLKCINLLNRNLAKAKLNEVNIEISKMEMSIKTLSSQLEKEKQKLNELNAYKRPSDAILETSILLHEEVAEALEGVLKEKALKVKTYFYQM